MHTIKITPNFLFEYQCTSSKFSRLTNRIKKSIRNRESNPNFFARIVMLYPLGLVVRLPLHVTSHQANSAFYPQRDVNFMY